MTDALAEIASLRAEVVRLRAALTAKPSDAEVEAAAAVAFSRFGPTGKTWRDPLSMDARESWYEVGREMIVAARAVLAGEPDDG